MKRQSKLLPTKRLIVLVVVICLLSATGSFPAAALTITPINPPLLDNITDAFYEYTTTNGQVTITKYNGTAASVTIPSKLGGNPVTVIGNLAFCGNKTLTTVVIPEGVASTGYNAFSSCTSLINVSFPSTLKVLGEEAFYSCSSLSSIILPAGLQEMGLYAFAGTNLNTITIPKSTTKVGDQAFHNCPNLMAIQVEVGNPAYVSLDGVLYDAAKTTLYKYPPKKAGTAYSIPTTTDKIDRYAMQRLEYLQTVTIPASVDFILMSAFEKCPNLTTVTFQGTSCYIMGGAFSNCPSLSNVTLPSGLKEIGNYTFDSCGSLKSITIPDTVTKIGRSAFKDCINLGQVKLPQSLTIIESTAFYKCTALQSISLPAKLTEIQGGAFAYGTNLTSVTFPAGILKINTRAFTDCTNLKDVRFLGAAPKLGDKVFYNATAGFKVYYPRKALNWTSPTWYGYPTQAYDNYSSLPLIDLRPIFSTPVSKDTGILIDPRNITLPVFPFNVDDTTVTDPPEASNPTLTPTPTPAGTTEIKLYLGNPNYTVSGLQQTMDTSPMLVDGRLLLPVKYIATPLGAVTSWDAAEQKVAISHNGNVIILWINKPLAMVNGVQKQIDPNNINVKPIIVPPGRTMLPLRFIGESLGCDVNWNQTLQEASLTYKP